jgi:hypothetical protein
MNEEDESFESLMTISKREIKNMAFKDNKNLDKKSIAELNKLVDSKR